MEQLLTIKLICLIFSSGPPDFWLSEHRQELICKQASTVISESVKNDIDPSLLLALITVESNWNRNVVSSANACGLTQVIPKYTGQITKKYTCNQLKDPKTSIKAGVKILNWWIKYHDGNITSALCGYNAGFRCGKDRKRPSRGGMRYAKKVLEIQKIILDKARKF
tara:strand:+ start:95 stop:592 length:498 start_codon:yes stop_codon:yes gene_type:complete